MCVVNTKATSEVDDLDVHEMLMVPRKHLQQYQSRFHLVVHLFDVAVQGGKN